MTVSLLFWRGSHISIASLVLHVESSTRNSEIVCLDYSARGEQHECLQKFEKIFPKCLTCQRQQINKTIWTFANFYILQLVEHKHFHGVWNSMKSSNRLDSHA